MLRVASFSEVLLNGLNTNVITYITDIWSSLAALCYFQGSWPSMPMAPTRSCKIKSNRRLSPWDNLNWWCWLPAVPRKQEGAEHLGYHWWYTKVLFCRENCKTYFANKSLQNNPNSLPHSKVTYISKPGTKHNSPPSISFHPESWQLFWRACLLLSVQTHPQCHLTACLRTENINRFTAVS